jgi:hypothetical protein
MHIGDSRKKNCEKPDKEMKRVYAVYGKSRRFEMEGAAPSAPVAGRRLPGKFAQAVLRGISRN